MIASVLIYALKFVNSFARRQHLFDSAAKSSEVDSAAPYSCSNFAQKVLV